MEPRDPAGDFANRRIDGAVGPAVRRLNIDPEAGANGLAGLALGLVRLIHELLERQAIRRMEAGSLADAEVERLGIALMKQAETIERLREAFGLSERDMELALDFAGQIDG